VPAMLIREIRDSLAPAGSPQMIFGAA